MIAGNFDTPNNSGIGAINPDCSGAFTTFGYNLIGMGDGCTGFTNGISGDIVGTLASPVDARLNLLAYYGGTTQTHTLAPGSPAIDSGSPLVPGGGGFGACAASDQRGVSRPQSTRCDIGATEGTLGLIFMPIIVK
jgi:hypothetical protein